MSWLYVPGVTASGSGSPSSFESIVSSVTWRGKHGPPQTWSRRWKREPWLRLLSGPSCEPSTLARGVERFISSLPESPASPSPSRGNGKGPRTNASSGPRLGISFAEWSPHSSSWRRSHNLYTMPFPLSSESWPKAGGMRSGICFRRPSWERRRGGGGSSCWPTITATDSTQRAYTRDAGKKGKERLSLAGRARTWPTPNVPDGGRSMRPEDVTRKGMTDKGKRQVGLRSFAACWPTPGAQDGQRAPGCFARGNPHLPTKAKNWAPPDTAPDAPQSNANVKCRPASLGNQAKAWPTPSAEPYGSNRGGAAGRIGKKRPSLDSLGRSFRPDPTISQLGRPSSRQTRRLNPLFVEHLMGWPIGWTDCGSAATESYRSWRRLHSWYLRNVLGLRSKA